jgi:histidinol-phosphate phosphatase family protein
MNIKIDNSWTLFLDRDGVINEESVGSYITNWDDFKFCEGVLEALKQVNSIFGNIMVVTNQRGVGKGIMSKDALKEIGTNMTEAIANTGGRIDKIYACTAIDDNDHNRKPNTGMAIQAKEDYPSIDFKRSVMIGNSPSDMEFGKRLGMYTIFITTKYEPYELPNDLVDEQYPTLLDWALSLKHATVVA